MIDFLKSFILGIVEGITEWLPISSTGHMILFNEFTNTTKGFLTSDVFLYVIQLGAILAVVVLYWKKIKTSVVEFFKYIFSKGKEGKTGFKFGMNVIIGCIPMGIVGVIFYSKIKKLFAIKTSSSTNVHPPLIYFLNICRKLFLRLLSCFVAMYPSSGSRDLDDIHFCNISAKSDISFTLFSFT